MGKAFAILEDEVQGWTTPDEDNIFRIRPESLMEVAVAAGSVEGRELNDGRIVFTLAGRVSRAHKVTISLRAFLAQLAHCVEGLNYPEVDHARESPVDLYGFEAEVDFPLGENERIRLYVETYNDVPKIAQRQDPWFLIARQDYNGGQEV